MTPDALQAAETAVLACLMVYPAQACGYAATAFNPAMFSASGRPIYETVQRIFPQPGIVPSRTYQPNSRQLDGWNPAVVMPVFSTWR